MTGPKPVALPLGDAPRIFTFSTQIILLLKCNLKIYLKILSSLEINLYYIPFIGTFRNDAIFIPFSSNSFIFKGLSG